MLTAFTYLDYDQRGHDHTPEFAEISPHEPDQVVQHTHELLVKVHQVVSFNRFLHSRSPVHLGVGNDDLACEGRFFQYRRCTVAVDNEAQHSTTLQIGVIFENQYSCRDAGSFRTIVTATPLTKVLQNYPTATVQSQ